MISITFPDGSKGKFKEGITPLKIAKTISVDLAEKALAAKVDGEMVDLSYPIKKDAEIKALEKAEGRLDEKRLSQCRSTVHLYWKSVEALEEGTRRLSSLKEKTRHFEWLKQAEMEYRDLLNKPSPARRALYVILGGACLLLAVVMVYFTLLIPAGIAVDRHGRTRFILASLMLSLVTMPLFVLSSNLVQVLLVRIAIAAANAFFAPASMALMADTIPRELRGWAMAAIGRGFVQLGPASGGTGGPGMGFLTTLPVMLGSIAGGYLYRYNPIYPWLFVSAATVLSIALAVLFLRDPEHAQV